MIVFPAPWTCPNEFIHEDSERWFPWPITKNDF